MDKKLYESIKNVSSEDVDEIYHIMLNNPSKFSKGKREAVSKRWHEIHDDDMRGV